MAAVRCLLSNAPAANLRHRVISSLSKKHSVDFSLTFLRAFSGAASTRNFLSVCVSERDSLQRKRASCGTVASATSNYTTAISAEMLIDISCRGLEATAASISDLQLAPKESDSAFVRPQSVLFSQDGKRRRWDMVITHPSVAIILYNTELDALVLVRQFRPAVYAAALGEAAKLAAAVSEGGNGGATTLAEAVPLSCAFVYELCAGIIDKPGLDLIGVAKEEVLEECGYDVPRDAFEKVTTCLTSVGISGAPQTVFYAEVTESMRVSKGGGSEKEGEAIDIVGLPAKFLGTFAETEAFPKSAGLMFACLWLQNRLKERVAA